MKTLNIKIDDELHSRARFQAYRLGKTIQSYVLDYLVLDVQMDEEEQMDEWKEKLEARPKEDPPKGVPKPEVKSGATLVAGAEDAIAAINQRTPGVIEDVAPKPVKRTPKNSRHR